MMTWRTYSDWSPCSIVFVSPFLCRMFGNFFFYRCLFFSFAHFGICKQKQKNRKKKIIYYFVHTMTWHKFTSGYLSACERFYVLELFGCLKSLTYTQAEKVTNFIAEGNFSPFPQRVSTTQHHSFPVRVKIKWKIKKKNDMAKKNRNIIIKRFFTCEPRGMFFCSCWLNLNGVQVYKNSRRNEIYYF